MSKPLAHNQQECRYGGLSMPALSDFPPVTHPPPTRLLSCKSPLVLVVSRVEPDLSISLLLQRLWHLTHYSWRAFLAAFASARIIFWQCTVFWTFTANLNTRFDHVSFWLNKLPISQVCKEKCKGQCSFPSDLQPALSLHRAGTTHTSFRLRVQKKRYRCVGWCSYKLLTTSNDVINSPQRLRMT